MKLTEKNIVKHIKDHKDLINRGVELFEEIPCTVYTGYVTILLLVADQFVLLSKVNILDIANLSN